MNRRIFVMAAILTALWVTSSWQAMAGCDMILRDGIREQYRLTQRDSEASSWNTYKEMSARQFQETYSNAIKEGRASADVVFVWNASGGIRFEETQYNKVIKTMHERQGRSGTVNLDRYYDLMVESLNPVIVDKYNECRRIESGGLIWWKKEHGDGEFTVWGSWRKRDTELPDEVSVTIEPGPDAVLIGEAPTRLTAHDTAFRFKLKDKSKGATIKIATDRGDYVEHCAAVPTGPNADELWQLRQAVAALRSEGWRMERSDAGEPRIAYDAESENYHIRVERNALVVRGFHVKFEVQSRQKGESDTRYHVEIGDSGLHVAKVKGNTVLASTLWMPFPTNIVNAQPTK